MIDTIWPIATTALACVSTCSWCWCAREVRWQKAELRKWHQRALVAGEELRFIHLQRHLAAKKGSETKAAKHSALVAETAAKLRASAK